MAQIRKTDDAFGVLFSVEGDRGALAEAVEEPAFLKRLDAIVNDEASPSDALQALLQLGTDWLNVEHGCLTDIDVADGTSTIAAASGPHPAVSEGETRPLPQTYDRTVLARDATLALHDAPADGWADDPAYEASGVRTYFGTKVVGEETLYGTLYFADRTARATPFTEAQAAALALMAHAAGRLLTEDPSSQPTPGQLEALFERSPNMINIHDAKGTLIAPNPHLCEKTGYTETELAGMKVWDIDQDVTPEAAQSFWADMEPGDRSSWEGTYQRKDGSTFPVEVDLRCIEVDGRLRFVATSRDITERREAEAALRSREELHRETLRHMTDTVLIARDDGTLTYVCPNVDHIFGYSREAVEEIGTVSALLGGDPADAYDIDDGEVVKNAEWRITDADGHPHDLLVNIRPVSIQDGHRMYTCRDVTERKNAEERLREEHDLLSRIFETSPAAITVLNTEGEFVEVSDRAKDVLGLDKSEVEERTYDDPAWDIRGPEGEPMPDEDLPFTQVMATGEPVYDVRHRIAWPDGSHRLLSVSGAPLRAPDGEMEGVVFHLDDITERQAAKQALQQERDRFATLFHNLPTPVVHGHPSEDGRLQIQAVNERFEDVFGYEEADIRGDDLQALIVPDAETDAAESMRRRLLSGAPVNREVRRRATDGLRDFRVQVALQDDDAPPTEGFAIYTDVTDRKERERALARRKALLEAQAEATIDGLLAVDTDRHAVFFNDRFLDIWNLSAASFAGSQPTTLTEQDFLEAASDLLPDPAAFREEIEYLHDHPDTDSRDVVQLTDGRWIDRYSAPIVGDEGGRFGRLWVFRNVTEQRAMVERLLEVQEEERRRIDQEIHDEMGGLLTSLQFTIDLARRTAPTDAVSTDHFDQLEDLVAELSTVSRTISRKLYPSALSERGLAEALQDLAGELEQKHDFDVDLYSEIEAGDRFSIPIERTAYWIVQEALMSIARRDDSDGMQVIVSERDEQLYLHLFDGADELSAATKRNETRFRFKAIRRRVEWLDGKIRIDPIPDEGTRLSVILPVRRPLLMR